MSKAAAIEAVTPGTQMDVDGFARHLGTLLPQSSADSRLELTGSVLPALVRAVGEIGEALRRSHDVSLVGTANAFGDAQLNVDVVAEDILRAACASAPAVRTASSEEDPVERPVVSPATPAAPPRAASTSETYTVAFDPLDGSSVIAPNFAVGAIIGVWDGPSALRQKPSEALVAAILGVFGPRTTAIVALRVPWGGLGTCLEVGLAHPFSVTLVRPQIRLAEAPFKTRYLQPANLRAAAENQNYAALVSYYIKQQYTLRYTGGLVPDLCHTLLKGHGVYVSPATVASGAKLRRLYELCPVALVLECAGGRAIDPADGTRVLDRAVGHCDERAGLICGTADEVAFAAQSLIAGLDEVA